MAQVIFCDFDGVIRHWDNQLLFETEESLNLPKGTTFKVAFAAENLIPAITGKISDEQWRANITQQLTQAISPQDALTLTQAWSNSPASIDYHIFDLLNTLLPQAQLALVTNATSKLNADLAAHDLISRFDFIINSSEIGVSKPESGFYKLAVEMTGAKLEESIFIDDSLRNVKSAEAFGLKAFHFDSRTGPNLLQKEVEKWLTKK